MGPRDACDAQCRPRRPRASPPRTPPSRPFSPSPPQSRPVAADRSTHATLAHTPATLSPGACAEINATSCEGGRRRHCAFPRCECGRRALRAASLTVSLGGAKRSSQALYSHAPSKMHSRKTRSRDQFANAFLVDRHVRASRRRARARPREGRDQLRRVLGRAALLCMCGGGLARGGGFLASRRRSRRAIARLCGRAPWRYAFPHVTCVAVPCARSATQPVHALLQRRTAGQLRITGAWALRAIDTRVGAAGN